MQDQERAGAVFMGGRQRGDQGQQEGGDRKAAYHGYDTFV
jgi:hypothetical protein